MITEVSIRSQKTRRLVYAVYPRIPPNTPLITVPSGRHFSHCVLTTTWGAKKVEKQLFFCMHFMSFYIHELFLCHSVPHLAQNPGDDTERHWHHHSILDLQKLLAGTDFRHWASGVTEVVITGMLCASSCISSHQPPSYQKACLISHTYYNGISHKTVYSLYCKHWRRQGGGQAPNGRAKGFFLLK